MYTRLEEVRTKLDLSKKKFAEDVLEVTEQAYQNYSTGKRDIPTQLLLRLTLQYRVSIDWLMTGTGHMFLDELDKLDFLITDFISLFGNRVETAKELEKFMISKILDRLGSQEHGLFARILDFITLGIADAGGVRPFLFLYYIFQIISADYQNNTIENFKDYIISKINSFDTKSLIENEPLFTQKMKDKFVEFVELKLTEKECQLLVHQSETVLTQLETRMPFLTVRLHRNKFKK